MGLEQLQGFKCSDWGSKGPVDARRLLDLLDVHGVVHKIALMELTWSFCIESFSYWPATAPLYLLQQHRGHVNLACCVPAPSDGLQ